MNKTKWPSYRFGIWWIAQNDNAGDNDGIEDIACYISVKLLADLFGKDEIDVASDVFKHRKKIGIEIKKEGALSDL